PAVHLPHHQRRPASDADRMPGRDRRRNRRAPGADIVSAELLREPVETSGVSPRDDSARAAELIARIESVPFSRWHVRPRVIMGSATFFDAFTALSLASATPVLVQLWGLTLTQVGYLLAASYI